MVTTVRSAEKGEALIRLFKNRPLSYKIVQDIAEPEAFDDAITNSPPLDAVVHTASPFHYKAEDNKRDMLDPAINGTLGILKAVQKNAPSVKRIVITSSFAAMANAKNRPTMYDEASWNPITMEEALATQNKQTAYTASKKFAERAAWDFVASEKPCWTLTVLNPPMIYGPVIQPGLTIDSLNTSSLRIWDIYRGVPRTGPAGSPMYVDVRDLAEAHVLSLENAGPANERFFLAAGIGTEMEMGDVMKKHFAEAREMIRSDLSSATPAYGIDNSKSKTVLGLSYRSLEDTIVDTVKSLKALASKLEA